jgi:hypothetical protein
MTSTTPSRNCTTSDIVSRVGASARGKSWGTDMSNQVDVKFPVTSHSYLALANSYLATFDQLSTTFLCFFPRFLSTVFCQTETII